VRIANLEVGAESYWLYTNDPFDNRKRREAFDTHGFEKGLAVFQETNRKRVTNAPCSEGGGFW
jgi:hypothetical protein